MKIMVVAYVFLILSVPVGAYLASSGESKNTKTSAKEFPKPSTITKESTPSAKPTSKTAKSSLIQEINALTGSTESATETDDLTTPTIATSFGSTLNLTTSLEGSPENKQDSRAYVGIRSATDTTKTDILTFTIDIPDSGVYTGLSLAGLTAGNQYLAVIKPTVQLAKAVNFTMSPSVTELNNGKAIAFLTGDINQDNVINSADYAIVRTVLGTNSKSANWNVSADFNKDGVINLLDIVIIIKNMGQIGDSGIWVSPIPTVASSSGALAPIPNTPPVGATEGSSGYWIWIPKN